MDVTTALALAAAIDHELPTLVQELMLDRERKAMQLEDLAVQGNTGRLFANVDQKQKEEEDVGPFMPWDDLVTDYADTLYPNHS